MDQLSTRPVDELIQSFKDLNTVEQVSAVTLLTFVAGFALAARFWGTPQLPETTTSNDTPSVSAMTNGE